MYIPGVYGEDCPFNNVVKSEHQCRQAASQLQMLFVGNVHGTKRPAGCYIKNNDAYFNELINPDLTSPSTDEAGICKGNASSSICPINT